MRNLAILFSVLAVAACNHIHMKPGTLDKNHVFFVDQGGGQMRLATKTQMEKRNYKLTVGHKKSSVSTTYITAEGNESKISDSSIGKARYIVFISESATKFRPIWCSLNGFWWLQFNMSIADNATGEELLHWTGRGCANSTVRKLNKILDELEQ